MLPEYHPGLQISPKVIDPLSCTQILWARSPKIRQYMELKIRVNNLQQQLCSV